jgi:hypothetical protein
MKPSTISFLFKIYLSEYTTQGVYIGLIFSVHFLDQHVTIKALRRGFLSGVGGFCIAFTEGVQKAWVWLAGLALLWGGGLH